MTPNGDFDRDLTAWLEHEAAPRAPIGLDTAFTDGVASTRQRPSWATTERWISMETRAMLGAVPRAVIIAITLLLLTALAASAILAGSSGPRLPAPFGPAANGPIAYAAGGDIWLVSTDGEAKQLTSGPAHDTVPAWSLDGSRIAYSSLVEGEYALMVAKADGGDASPVAADLAASPGFVRWKPDSTAVAFARVDESLVSDECIDRFSGVCGSRVWVAAADGSSFEQVGPDDLDAYAPGWSPDGSRIVFSGRVAGEDQETFGLFVMDAEGADLRRLGDITGPPGRSLYWHRWSPDGTRIATQVPNTIYVVDAETGDATAAYNGPAANFVAWSPDGRELAVSAYQVGGVIVGEDGQQRAVDSVPAQYLHWTPDGTMLAGVSELDLASLGSMGTGEDAAQPYIHLLDLDGELITSIETVEFSGDPTIDMQRLAP